MNEPLPIDVRDRLIHDFGERADVVAALLIARRQNDIEDFIGDRVLRCIVQAASGNEHRLPHLLELAKQDYRDVIVAGEYDEDMRQIRSLRDSFLIDSPEKFWASNVTSLMARRGYRLTALDTRPATVGPFGHQSDHSEGLARFTGPIGEIEIEKKSRQWIVHSNRGGLAAYRMDRPFSNERAFLDALSGYLLMAMRASDGVGNG